MSDFLRASEEVDLGYSTVKSESDQAADSDSSERTSTSLPVKQDSVISPEIGPVITEYSNPTASQPQDQPAEQPGNFQLAQGIFTVIQQMINQSHQTLVNQINSSPVPNAPNISERPVAQDQTMHSVSPADNGSGGDSGVASWATIVSTDRAVTGSIKQEPLDANANFLGGIPDDQIINLTSDSEDGKGDSSNDDVCDSKIDKDDKDYAEESSSAESLSDDQKKKTNFPNCVARKRKVLNSSGSCEVCGEWTNALQIHMKRHESINRSTGAKKRHHCKLCNVYYDHAGWYRRHMKTCHKRVEVPKNGESYKLKNSNIDQSLKKGKALVPEKIKRCNLCGKNIVNIASHREVHQPFVRHSGKRKPHKCKLCRSYFVRVNHYDNHMRDIHGQDKPSRPAAEAQNSDPEPALQTCGICGVQRRNIDAKHMRIHNPICDVTGGRKRYECTICKAYFNSRGAYCVHIKVIHGSAERKCSADSSHEGFTTSKPQRSECSSPVREDGTGVEKDIAPLSSAILPELDTPSSCICKLCELEFDSNKSLQEHMIDHNLFDNTGLEKQHSCEKCKCYFAEEVYYFAHLGKFHMMS